jgi:hypothetical protein
VGLHKPGELSLIRLQLSEPEEGLIRARVWERIRPPACVEPSTVRDAATAKVGCMLGLPRLIHPLEHHTADGGAPVCSRADESRPLCF